MKTINIDNASIINTKEIYLHDSYIKQIECFLSERKIVVSVDPYSKFSNIKKLTFNKVVGTKTTFLEMFGPLKGRILDFYYFERKETTLINDLYDEREKEKSNIVECTYKGEIIRDAVTSNMDNMEQLIETEFLFDSADKMTIVCEYIEIETA